MDCLRPIWYQNLERGRHVKFFQVDRSNREQPHDACYTKNVHKIIGAFCRPRRNRPSLSLLPFQTDPLSEVRILEDLLQGGSDLRIKHLEVWILISQN